jgi:uncharacterized protein YbgA (DUF1722 family)
MRLLWVCIFLLYGYRLFAQGWEEHSVAALKKHQNEYPGQTVSICIFSADTSISLFSGPMDAVYSDSTHFKAGWLLMHSQAYFSAEKSISEKAFLSEKVLKDITVEQLLTHYSGFPRYPWTMDSCNSQALLSFASNYRSSGKASFQVAFTGISVLEHWLREHFPSYPSSVFQHWGIQPVSGSELPDHAASSKVIRHELPIQCWPFCMSCEQPGLWLSKMDAEKLLQEILESDEIWSHMMQPRAKTPLPTLQMALGFQIATNMKKLPLAMLASTDGGNSCFIAIAPNTRTGILILGDTDEPVDNLGLSLMSFFHTDILKFKP